MKELASIENKISRLNVSESELAFLAFVFIATLGCFMLGRRRHIPPVRRPNKKKHKRVNCNHCCLNSQDKNQPRSQVLSPTRRETLVGFGHVVPEQN